MQRLEETILPTQYGNFDMFAYESVFKEFPHIAMRAQAQGDGSAKNDPAKPVNVRIHSECMTGDVFASSRCDCGEQLHYAMQYVATHGGLIVYLRQEGRGIGLVNKMKAYNLQDQGYDTFEANVKLGFHQDARDFGVAAHILHDLGVSKINLLTNNPQKLSVLNAAGIEVVERIPVEIAPSAGNHDYLQSKKQVMGHMLKSV